MGTHRDWTTNQEHAWTRPRPPTYMSQMCSLVFIWVPEQLEGGLSLTQTLLLPFGSHSPSWTPSERGSDKTWYAMVGWCWGEGGGTGEGGRIGVLGREEGVGRLWSRCEVNKLMKNCPFMTICPTFENMVSQSLSVIFTCVKESLWEFLFNYSLVGWLSWLHRTCCFHVFGPDDSRESFHFVTLDRQQVLLWRTNYYTLK